MVSQGFFEGEIAPFEEVKFSKTQKKHISIKEISQISFLTTWVQQYAIYISRVQFKSSVFVAVFF